MTYAFIVPIAYAAVALDVEAPRLEHAVLAVYLAPWRRHTEAVVRAELRHRLNERNLAS